MPPAEAGSELGGWSVPGANAVGSPHSALGARA